MDQEPVEHPATDDRLVQRLAALTDSQRRLLRLAASGATNSEIALRLGWAVATVERERARLVRVLGVRSDGEATVLWWGTRAGSPPHVTDVARALLAGDEPEPHQPA